MILWQDFKPHPVFGLDEVGRGCLSGPVVAAAATPKSAHTKNSFLLSDLLPEQDSLSKWYQDQFLIWLKTLDLESSGQINFEITDSKKLSAKKRNQVLSAIYKDFDVCVALAGPREIDQINILQASLLSMRRASLSLAKHINSAPGHLLVDGTFKVPHMSCPQTTLIKGDLNCQLISAASIVAKVFRDYLMEQLDLLYPGYHFAGHKGYPSPTHKAAISKLGPCEQHRMTFKGVSP